MNWVTGERSAEFALDFYGDDDYYISSQPIRLHCRGFGLFGESVTECYDIPAEAKIVVLRDDWRGGNAWGRFKLDESSEFSSSCIRAVVKLKYDDIFLRCHESWSKRSESSGCWKQV